MRLNLQGWRKEVDRKGGSEEVSHFSTYLPQNTEWFFEASPGWTKLFGQSAADPRGFTCDAVLVAQQPELIQDAEHLDDVAREERQLLGDAGEELEHGTHHRPGLHLLAPVERRRGR